MPLPHVLISNDDGYDAPGLRALHAALSGMARVSVVAPARGVSSAGHGVTDRRPIDVERCDVEPFGMIHIVDGLPADCARLGVLELLDERPDWVVSGINRGGNLGVDVFYSGTVAVAREAAFLGIPAVAVSQYVRAGLTEIDWPRATEWTRDVLQRILAGPTASRPPVWNVNLPSLPSAEESLGIVNAPMALTPLHVRYRVVEESSDARRRTYEFAGQYGDRPVPPGSDVDLAFRGHIIVTPLLLDLTDRGASEVS
ncbi:MAG: 5'/3'-nucleotidase SurE [Phycisphaerae bacterium]|nr:5'/3'-nucleotidase SurE [Phycisphaerae bacterium]